MPAARPEIGPYRVVRPLGQGGMGTVLLAEDTRLSRLVALKAFSGPEARTEYARQQLLREARAAAALSHQNIAAVHDVLDVDGQVIIVFEYVEGDTLSSRIARGSLTVPASLAIAVQLADALAAAHGQGIVHRDLKPGNVIIMSDGLVKVLDFGVARVLPTDPSAYTKAHTTSAAFVGTVGYAAPEQCLGQSVDARADVFSLSVVLFEMLTGKRPFPGQDATTVMRAMLQTDPPRVALGKPEVSPALDSLIARGLSPNPSERPQTVGEFREGLRALAPTDVRAHAVAPRRRGWVVAALIATVLGTGVLVSSLIPGRITAPSTTSVTKPPVVAVMPLANASGDAANDYLALGVAESLITRLAALPSITVLSRSAVADARGRLPDLPALAAELDASYLVDGSVQQSGDRLAINLSLVRPDTSVAWADTVEGTFDQIFTLQTRLASALAQALVVQLSAADRASLAEQPTRSSEALAAYWRGRALLERRDIRGNLDAALSAFDLAIRQDPRFAIAHAARGEALWARYLDTRNPQTAQEAIEAGTTALRLDPGEPQVRYSLALTLAGNGRLEEATEELQRALALQPNYDEALSQLGSVLARLGRLDEAVAEFRKAIALRPNFAGHYYSMGVSLLLAARYGDAAAAFERVVQLQPNNTSAYNNLGIAYRRIDRTEEAVANWRKAIAISPSAQPYSNIGAVLHEKGDYAGAIDAYRKAIDLRPNSHITHRNLGDALLRLGRKMEARDAHRRAVALAEADLGVNPRDAVNLAQLSVYLAKLGDDRGAMIRLQQAQQLAPNDVEVQVRAGVVHALGGRPDTALFELRRAVQSGFSVTAIKAEEDLVSLSQLPAFKALVTAAPSTGDPR